MEALLSDLERSGPEALGGPLRAVVVLAKDAGELHPGPADALGVRRRRAAAARLARRAMSLASGVQGAIADRPETSRAWSWNLREVSSRLAEPAAGPSDAECLRGLARVADLVLLLPQSLEADDWQLGAIAFADEGVLAELREACLDLAVAALRLANDP